jgi:cell wall-associated NlpC family hydrolase
MSFDSTLLYSPGVRILISAKAKNGKFVDVSEDIESGNLTINENKGHSLSFTLSNQNGKYSSLFHPNDRVVVQMKRLTWVQVFAGYLDKVPYFSAFPKSVNLNATCTSKKIYYHYWDPAYQGTIEWIQSLISGNAPASGDNDAVSAAAGIPSAITGILHKVVGWEKDRIHIGGVPQGWFDDLAPIWQQVQQEVLGEIAYAQTTSVGAYFTAGGNVNGSTTSDAAAVNGVTPPLWGSFTSVPAGCDLPRASGQATHYDLTQSQDPATTSGGIVYPRRLYDPDHYFAAAHFGYMDLPQDKWGNAKALLKGPDGAGMRVVVTNADNGKQVVVRMADAEEATGRCIDLSPEAFTALLGPNQDISIGVLNVNVAWCQDPQHPTGAVSSPVATAPNHLDTPVGSTTSNSNPAASTTAAHSTTARQRGAQQDKKKGKKAPPTSPAQAPNADKVVSAALAQVGKPYIWGSAGPNGFDCSGLTSYAWSQAGIQLAHYTGLQYHSDHVQIVPIEDRKSGDLLFIHGSTEEVSHVAMYVGTIRTADGTIAQDQIIEAPNSGSLVHTMPLSSWWGIDNAYLTSQGGYFLGVGRVTANAGTNNATGASVVVDKNNLTTVSTGVNSGQSMIYGNGIWNPGAANADPWASAYSGYKLMMNDTTVLPYINQLITAGQRSWCTAPNGDFIAWFPDYFGRYGYAAKWKLSPVEMQEFTIDWSDANLVTHNYAYGTSALLNQTLNPNTNSASPPQAYNELQTYGVATIDVPGLLKAIANVQDGSVWSSPQEIYQQFGARINTSELPIVAANSPAEFWFAVKQFVDFWTKQFTATVNLTFMPELYPGMLLVIDELGFQAYIKSVTHTWGLGAGGGGFSTSVQITAPSATDGSGLVGLARAGGPG